MKKLLFSLIMLPLLLLFGSCVPVARPEPDYREMVIRAAAEGEAEAGREARDFWAAGGKALSEKQTVTSSHSPALSSFVLAKPASS